MKQSSPLAASPKLALRVPLAVDRALKHIGQFLGGLEPVRRDLGQTSLDDLKPAHQGTVSTNLANGRDGLVLMKVNQLPNGVRHEWQAAPTTYGTKGTPRA